MLERLFEDLGLQRPLRAFWTPSTTGEHENCDTCGDYQISGHDICTSGEGPPLLLRNRSPGPVHEGLHLLQSEVAIFVGIHCPEDSFVSRLKFLQ